MSRPWQIAFAIGSALLGAVVLLGLVLEHNPPWRQIQQDKVAGRTTEAPGMVEIRGPAGVERCLTCHFDLLWTENPAKHPEVFANHPPYVTGCLGCHGGDARSLDKNKIHAATGIDRLETKKWRSSRCALCHVAASRAPDSAVLEGILLFEQLGCQVCHRAYDRKEAADRQGGFGPDLDNAGRHDPETLKRMLLDPIGSFGDTTQMPPFTQVEAHQQKLVDPLISYLLTLRSGWPRPKAKGQANSQCIGCHSVDPARGLDQHRCPYIVKYKENLRCQRCHSTPVEKAATGSQSCLYIDQQRPVCTACHTATGARLGQ